MLTLSDIAARAASARSARREPIEKPAPAVISGLRVRRQVKDVPHPALVRRRFDGHGAAAGAQDSAERDKEVEPRGQHDENPTAPVQVCRN
jgi:hypothetical protein